MRPVRPRRYKRLAATEGIAPTDDPRDRGAVRGFRFPRLFNRRPSVPCMGLTTDEVMQISLDLVDWDDTPADSIVYVPGEDIETASWASISNPPRYGWPTTSGTTSRSRTTRPG
ncbi:hypothetical protein GCM10009000_088800 [Halobacterium noricense]